MRAISFPAFDQPAALTDLPVPEPGPGEVLVEVHASSLNGFDLGVLGGHLKGVFAYEFPVVLGRDFAGVVAELGAGVDHFTVGQAVFGVVLRPTLGQGGFAEYVAVPADQGIAPIPAGLDPQLAAALGLAGTAAHDAVDAVAPTEGETVLVVGATGGVGGYATQLAAARGAAVIATARPGAEAAFVTAHGATHTVDPDGDLAAQVRALAPAGVHAALHLAGDGAAVAGLVAAGGRFASTLHHVPAEASDIEATAVLADPSPATLAALAEAVVAGRLRVPLGRRYPLAEVPQALAEFGAGTLGKVGVTV
ncbi:alcohol dehydrogenase catalytic domain-containing protein [Kitasatospora sp. NPDC093806]|uniref:alcohol dehydrogenase catalytic domain-containing protein n=1 Tax=Kitasatospora sp. NPDC093806 TaxID=3155075 RepID=UPI00341A0E1D